MSVVPKKTDAGSDHGPAEDRQLGHLGHLLQLQVFGKGCVSANVSQHGKASGGNDCAANRQAIEAIGQVDRVGRAHQNQHHK